VASELRLSGANVSASGVRAWLDRAVRCRDSTWDSSTRFSADSGSSAVALRAIAIASCNWPRVLNFGVINDFSPDWHNAACTPNIVSGKPADESATADICPIAGVGYDAPTPAVDTTNEGTPDSPVYNDPLRANNLRDKLKAETKQWARVYEGVPVLCMEESDFCVGVDQGDLDRLLTPDAAHAFAGVVCTWPFFADSLPGGRHRLEQVDWKPRVGAGVGFDLGIETFGNSVREYGEGHVLLRVDPTYAEEEWRIMLGAPPEGVAGLRVRDLSLQRNMARVRIPQPGNPITAEELIPVVRRLLPDLPE
jgi:hypothetical protein